MDGSANQGLWIGLGVLCLVVAGFLLMNRESGEVSGDRNSKDGPLVIYCGRSEELVGPLLEQYRTEAGDRIEVRYGQTTQMAATILEEGAHSPADLFIAQDTGALGALAGKDLLAPLPEDILGKVDSTFRSPNGVWVGLSGRARVVVYNTQNVSAEDLPGDITGFCDPSWKGRLGWAPANGSFQAFVTAFRALKGEEEAESWLHCILANEVRDYPKNTPIVAAVGAGEIDVGFVNHYYLYRFLAEEGETFPARIAFLRSGEAGSLVNVSGIGILATSRRQERAADLVRYLLSEPAQRFFSQETYEYPMVQGVAPHPDLPSLVSLQPPHLDLSALEDLEGTLQLLKRAGAL